MEALNVILMETFELPETEVHLDLSMDDVATWDSLTHMNLIAAIEKEYKFQLSGDDIADMLSFTAIRTIVKGYLG